MTRKIAPIFFSIAFLAALSGCATTGSQKPEACCAKAEKAACCKEGAKCPKCPAMGKKDKKKSYEPVIPQGDRQILHEIR